MIALGQVVIVEGKYDKARIKQIFDATVIDLGGFAIFKNKEKQALIRKLAEERGILIITDSDGAGLVIRNFLRGITDKSRIWHAYVPQLCGKEKRKARPGKEGLLGVEGIPADVIIEAVRKSGAMDADKPAVPAERHITKTVMYELGLSGGAGSAALRKDLCRRLGLPDNISANSLGQVLTILYGPEELAALVDEIRDA